MNRFVLPLAIFAALIALLAVGLTLNPREVPSPLIGKPAPHFELPQLDQAAKTFTEKDMVGRVWMLNVWASWCVTCREEHPVLLGLAKSMGDPYQLSIHDVEGKVGIDYGVYGVPETYVIDKRGVIRYKRIGALTPEIVRDKVLPLVQELGRG